MITAREGAFTPGSRVVQQGTVTPLADFGADRVLARTALLLGQRWRVDAMGEKVLGVLRLEL